MIDHGHNSFLRLLIAVLSALLTASCAERLRLPTELELKRVLYQTERKQAFGPGGLNQSFVVYELPKEASAKISAGGLPYLNSLPSVAEQKKKFKPPRTETVTYSQVKCVVPGCPEETDPKNIVTRTFTAPYRAPFVVWNATPVPKEAKWLRSGNVRDFGEQGTPSLTTFYASFKDSPSANAFIATISPEFVAQFHEVISTPGNFYAYGYYRDMCVLVVSPTLGKAFYLFRD